MRSDEADALGSTGMVDLDNTTAKEFLQLMYGMLEGIGVDGVGTEVQFEDIDGVIKAVWIERWEDV